MVQRWKNLLFKWLISQLFLHTLEADDDSDDSNVEDEKLFEKEIRLARS